MMLIIGGRYQGKTTYAKTAYNLKKSDIVSGEKLDVRKIKNVKCIDDLEEYIKKLIQENKDVMNEIEKIKSKNKDLIFICDEVGCGIVPMKKTDRLYRDMVGKVCCNIANDSEKVIRMFASIPIIIKS